MTAPTLDERLRVAKRIDPVAYSTDKSGKLYLAYWVRREKAWKEAARNLKIVEMKDGE